MVHDKRLPAPKHYPIARKETSYVSTIEGSRSRENAIPAVLVLRDVLGYAENEKDAKKIIRNQQLLRNGEPITDIKQGVGVLDVIEIPETDESYRVIRTGKGLNFVPVTDPEKVVAKITGKDIDDTEYVYRLHNGENYRSEKEYSTGNTLVFGSSVDEIPLEEGAEVLIMKGKHAGKTAELEEINRRGMNPDTGIVSNDGQEIETQLENLVAIKNIDLGEN